MSCSSTPGNLSTILLDFSVPSCFCTKESSSHVIAIISNFLAPQFGGLELVVGRTLPLGKQPDYGQAFFLASSCEKGVTVMIKTFLPRAHITVTIDYDQKQFEGNPVLDYKGISELEASMAEAFLGVKKTCTIPELKRALESDIYFTTTDFRVLEYDFSEMLFDEMSEFQHVQVARSINYGNVLILDGLVNMADSDITYTETIMARGEVDYADKDVLILGGGDGGLLHELEKTRANSVTMIEIDEVVIKACKKYLRGVCGDSLDKYKRDKYEIIVGDCIPFLETCKKEGRTFDVIFGDLTELPISSGQQEEIWQFFRKALHLAFSVLKSDGSYLTHANGASSENNLKLFEKTIRETLEFPLNFKSSSAFVPSFHEKWIFYQIKRA